MKFISILLIIFALNIYSDAGIYKANWGNTDQTSSAKQIDLYRLASWQINGSESINSKTLPFYSDTEDTLVFLPNLKPGLILALRLHSFPEMVLMDLQK